MSPVRNASRALADVMERSERRGAEAERQRLLSRARSRHQRAGHEASDLESCGDPGCVALREVLGSEGS